MAVPGYLCFQRSENLYLKGMCLWREVNKTRFQDKRLEKAKSGFKENRPILKPQYTTVSLLGCKARTDGSVLTKGAGMMTLMSFQHARCNDTM